MLQIITRGKFRLTIGVFSIAFAMSVIGKVGELIPEYADDAIRTAI